MNIDVRMDEDVNKVIAKLKKVSAARVVFLVPKNAALFFDLNNLKLLKSSADELGKDIALMTMDVSGQEYAQEIGIKILDPRTMTIKNRVAFDVGSKPKKLPEIKDNFNDGFLEVKLSDLPKYSDESKNSEIPVVAPTPRLTSLRPEKEPFIEKEPFVEKKSFVQKESFTEKQSSTAVPKLAPIRKSKKSAQSGLRMLAFLSVVMALGVALILMVFVLPQATLTVTARTVPLQSTMKINATADVQTMNLDQNSIHGAVVNTEVHFSKQFDATGKTDVGGKAGGRVQIYNFTGKLLRLNAQTTIFIIGEKKYTIDHDILSIPPTRYISGTKNIDTQSLGPEVTMYAEQSGPGYQAAKGVRVEIQNQSFGNHPNLLYGTTSSEIEGGDSRFSSVLTESDLQSATKQLVSDIQNQAQKQVLEKDNLTIIPSGIRIDSQSVVFDKNVGDATVNFVGTVTARITAVGFNYNLLQDLVRQKVAQTLPKNQHIPDNSSLNLSEAFSSVDYEHAAGVLQVSVNAKASVALDTRGISSEVTGKTPEEIKEVLLSNPDVESVGVELSPFWVKSVPKYSGRVRVVERQE